YDGPDCADDAGAWFLLHDGRPADRFVDCSGACRRCVLSRSESCAVVRDVGALRRDVVCAAVGRASRQACVLSFEWRFSGLAVRVGSKYLQLGTQVHGAMKLLLTGVNHKTAPVE